MAVQVLNQREAVFTAISRSCNFFNKSELHSDHIVTSRRQFYFRLGDFYNTWLSKNALLLFFP